MLGTVLTKFYIVSVFFNAFFKERSNNSVIVFILFLVICPPSELSGFVTFFSSCFQPKRYLI